MSSALLSGALIYLFLQTVMQSSRSQARRQASCTKQKSCRVVMMATNPPTATMDPAIFSLERVVLEPFTATAVLRAVCARQESTALQLVQPNATTAKQALLRPPVLRLARSKFQPVLRDFMETQTPSLVSLARLGLIQWPRGSLPLAIVLLALQNRSLQLQARQPARHAGWLQLALPRAASTEPTCSRSMASCILPLPMYPSMPMSSPVKHRISAFLPAGASRKTLTRS